MMDLNEILRGIGDQMAKATPAWSSMPSFGSSQQQQSAPSLGGPFANYASQMSTPFPATPPSYSPFPQTPQDYTPFPQQGQSYTPFPDFGKMAVNQQTPFPNFNTSSSSSPNTGTTMSSNGGDANVLQWQDKINAASSKTGVPTDVLAAIMHIESHGSMTAKSGAGAMGAMQVMPFHFKAGENPFDPDTNITRGAEILSDNYSKYHDWDKAAAAYFGAIDGNGNITNATDSGGQNGPGYVKQFNDARALYPAVANRQAQSDPVAPTAGGANYVFPVAGYTGKVQLHWGSVKGGSDLMAPRGTPVSAMRSGHVTEAGWDNVGGNSVLVQGDDGNQYYYAHLDAAPSVKVGQDITAGTYLGPVGNTGDASGGPTHLHIGIGPSIKLGADKYGGTGGDYDAVSLLQSVLDAQGR